jgi:hypothetical protein
LVRALLARARLARRGRAAAKVSEVEVGPVAAALGFGPWWLRLGGRGSEVKVEGTE